MVNAIPTLKELLYRTRQFKHVYDAIIIRYEIILSEADEIIRTAH